MKSHNPLQPVTTRAILLTLFLFMLISVSNAQVTCAPSGTGIRPNTTTVPTSPVWLNVFYHIVRKTDHTGGIAPSEIGNITTYLNRYFNPYGLYINNLAVGGVNFDFIDNDASYVVKTDAFASLLFGQQVKTDVMNIYIVDRLEGAGGCAKDIPSSSFIIGSDGVFSTNICHELGHCLGLFHTHETAFCVENIARNNCSDCGDFICDTPADPNLTGRLDGSTCTYINPITQNGVSYTPDTRNLMSYGCKEKLTPMQTKAIINRASISSDRNTSLAIPTINGASAFCTSTTLTVSNIRMGYSVNWESSNTAVATVSISGTVNKVSDGTVTITAEITNGNDAHFVTKTLSVGKPTVIDGSYTRGSYTYPVSGTYNGITVSSSLPYVYITMQPLSSDIISYNWTKVSAYKSHSFAYSANQATVYLSSGAYANITCTWNNACGSSPVVSFNCYNYSAFRLVASPNAVSQTLTVEAQLLSEAEAQNSTEKLLKSKDKNNIIVKLRDKNGNIVDSGKLKDGILKLNVAHLPNDTYFLQMSEDDELVVKQIVVRH